MIKKLDAIESIGEAIPLLKVWSIANFSGTEHEPNFSFRGEVSEWAKTNNPQPMPPISELSHLERAVRNQAPFKYSVEAHEHYLTPIETEPKLTRVDDLDYTIYGSVNIMLMNGFQREHYHPDFNQERFPKCSTRVGIVFPALNTEFEEQSGLTFSIRPVEDPNLRLSDRTICVDEVVATHKVHFPPGQVAIMLFRDGAHSFQGSGMVVSVHPLDVGSHNMGNTYDANTVGVSWDAEGLPMEPVEVSILQDFQVDKPKYNPVHEAFPDVMRITHQFVSKITEDHDPNLPELLTCMDALQSDLRDLYL